MAAGRECPWPARKWASPRIAFCLWAPWCLLRVEVVQASFGNTILFKDWFNAKQTRLNNQWWCTNLCTSIWWSEMACVAPISNAILWTPFVTPRGDQAQLDQTDRFSYCKKGKSLERAGSDLLFWPSRTPRLLWYWGAAFKWRACTKVEINWVCLCAFSFEWGRLACPVPNQWRVSVIYRAMLIWNGPKPTRLEWGKGQSTHAFVLLLARTEGMWTACWWPSLMRLVHLGIHRGLVRDAFAVAGSQGSSLRRPWFLLLWQTKKPVRLDDVRSGNKAVSTLWVRQEGSLSLRHQEGLKFDSTERTNSHRKKGGLSRPA